MISTILSIPLASILADPELIRLTLGQEAATELGLAALEHLEASPTDGDLQSLAIYAARHDENAPARDALVAVLCNASGTLNASLVAVARSMLMGADWGAGRESAGLTEAPDVNAVPRRQALAERLMAERARRLRPRMHVLVAGILAGDPDAVRVPSYFLERNWIDLRETLVQRIRAEPLRHDAITQWLTAQHAAVRSWLRPLEDALVDAAIHDILHAPERAALAPHVHADRVAHGVRSAVTFRGEPARGRLLKYLVRLTPGTEWHETIRLMTVPPQ